ncbi:conserved hypothetical protein [Alteracholeplasma palmae J233]|uniref:tRNA uridine(34) hydroxylase n=1 Tax=Alteracholeplasma palmae (strain ATCC 49389 / J233) TaxID=1318466 RepID=U4KR51_ALTPJ|nr:rhodanese-related sulfurtransferase [Alteracholeplasma palmae]CCV63881.1 conserved hypothetical protein [Alteracholeplasma palmae J233]
MSKDYRVLLYYQYVHIEDPETFKEEHLKFCKELGVLGRILVSKEGINGTLSGTVEQTDAYIKHLRSDERFKNTMFKIDEEDGHAFDKIFVRVKDELVNLKLENDVNPLELTGNYLTPEEFYQYMQDEDTVVIDARNDYEYDLGHFRNAVRPDISNFRELPNWIKENEEILKDKKILTYCTGGVRCEKFSGWLKQEGHEDVNQLHGGIATYGKDPKVKGALWDGQMYVFDKRISVPINKIEHVIVGKDYFDGTPCERYINCSNPECNKQIITSEENEAKYLGACCDECRRHPRNRYVIKNVLSQEEVEKRLSLI